MFNKNSLNLKTRCYLLVFLSLIAFNRSHLDGSTNQSLNEQENRKAFSFFIDYKEAESELCLIGAKYDTDKSSQRKNVTSLRHCHPYTLFYHSLFRDKKNANLAIAELGILEGSSLLMWREYFPNTAIYGFDNNINFINSFLKKFNGKDLFLDLLDVKSQESITTTFSSIGIQYDLIIEDTTHQFEDQIRVIENIYPFLKPGGMLIVEDIFKSYNEQDYLDRLRPILDQFQDYYFVTLDHKNRNSTGWDNDKLFILVKAGEKPIFANQKKLTIITPSIRPSNLFKLKDSIDFDYVNEWIIVYDGSKINKNPNLFINENNPKIKEYIFKGEGISGNPQRNFALNNVQNEDTYIYFLDDDNLMHSDLYKFLNIIDDEKIYTFNQANRLKGNSIDLGGVDAAMFLVDYKFCKKIKWKLGEYAADYYFIHDCYLANKKQWIWVDNTFSYYNSL